MPESSSKGSRLPAESAADHVTDGEEGRRRTRLRRTEVGTLSASGAARAIIGVAGYLTLIGVFAVALGFIIRSTAGGVATLFALLLVLPGLGLLLPSSWENRILPYLPSNAGSTMFSRQSATDSLSAGVSLLVLLPWVATALPPQPCSSPSATPEADRDQPCGHRTEAGNRGTPLTAVVSAPSVRSGTFPPTWTVNTHDNRRQHQRRRFHGRVAGTPLPHPRPADPMRSSTGPPPGGPSPMRTSRLDHVPGPALSPPDARRMTAIVQDRYGTEPEDVLRLSVTDRPPVTDQQVLVRVRAASVDRGTWHIMAGLPYPIRVAGFGVRRPRFLNPGRSLAGTVEAVGAQVSGLKPGEDVFGVGEGTLAEYAVTIPDKLARKPANQSYEQAAALPVSGLTALQAVRDHAQVRSGDKVLIVGASGGVGTFAVQIARAFGAEVTGVSSTTKLALVRALGADHVIDYTAEDVTAGGQRFDVILDTGGNTRLRHLRRALTTHGRLVIVGGETDGRLLGGSGRQVRATLLSPFLRQQLGTFIASENAHDLQALRELVEAGELTPAVDRTYPLVDAAAALRRLVAGQVSGKVVVSIDPGTP